MDARSVLDAGSASYLVLVLSIAAGVVDRRRRAASEPGPGRARGVEVGRDGVTVGGLLFPYTNVSVRLDFRKRQSCNFVCLAYATKGYGTNVGDTGLYKLMRFSCDWKNTVRL